MIPCHLWIFPGFTPTITTPACPPLTITFAPPRNRPTVIVVEEMFVNVGVGGNDETGVPFRGNPLAVRRIRYCRAGRRWEERQSFTIGTVLAITRSQGRHAGPTLSSLTRPAYACFTPTHCTGVYHLGGLLPCFGYLLTTTLSGQGLLFGVLTHWSHCSCPEFLKMPYTYGVCRTLFLRQGGADDPVASSATSVRQPGRTASHRQTAFRSPQPPACHGRLQVISGSGSRARFEDRIPECN